MAWSTVQVDPWRRGVSKCSELVNTREAATYLGLAAVTLRQWRWRGQHGQPPFVRCGSRSIRYRRQALEQWARQREVKAGAGKKNHEPGGRQTRRARGDN